MLSIYFFQFLCIILRMQQKQFLPLRPKKITSHRPPHPLPITLLNNIINGMQNL